MRWVNEIILIFLFEEMAYYNIFKDTIFFGVLKTSHVPYMSFESWVAFSCSMWYWGGCNYWSCKYYKSASVFRWVVVSHLLVFWRHLTSLCLLQESHLCYETPKPKMWRVPSIFIFCSMVIWYTCGGLCLLKYIDFEECCQILKLVHC